MTRRVSSSLERPELGEDFIVILAAAQAGGCAASTSIYEWLAPAVAGYLRAQGADEPDDLVSEVFLRVFADCRSFSGTEGQFRSWVFSIAHSRLVDARRAKNRAPDMQPLEAECLDGECPSAAGAEDEAMDRLAITAAGQLLGTLTTDQRDVLAMRLIGQMSVEETATALQKPQGAIKALQRRALATLRRRLGPEAADQ